MLSPLVTFSFVLLTGLSLAAVVNDAEIPNAAGSVHQINVDEIFPGVSDFLNAILNASGTLPIPSAIPPGVPPEATQPPPMADNPTPVPSAEPSAEPPVRSASPSPSVSPAGPASPTPESAVCFPSHATVELAGGKRVAMRDVRLGDRVRTGPETFSDVFLFTHRDAGARSAFVRLVTAAGPALTLTRSHYLYVGPALVAAGSVRAGDALQLADGRASRVVAVENVSGTGLYNPQTVDGNIAVDGVVASTYTTAVHPRVAHGALLAPLRALFSTTRRAVPVLDALSRLIGARSGALSQLVPSGPAGLAA